MSVTDHSPESAQFGPLPERQPTSANGDHADGPPSFQYNQDRLPRRDAPPFPPDEPGPLPHRGAESLPRRGGEPMPQRAAAGPLPQRNGAEPLPRRDNGAQPLPRRDGGGTDPLPRRDGGGTDPLPRRGEPAGAPGPVGVPPGMLPRRGQGGRPRRVGRHRSLHRISVASDAPALVLAVPGRGDAVFDLASHIAEAAMDSCPGVQIRVGFLDAATETLGELLGSDSSHADVLNAVDDTDTGDLTGPQRTSGHGRRGAAPRPGREPAAADFRPDQAPEAVVVPLLAGPHPRYDAAIAAAIGSAAGRVMLATSLGPHPLLAGALHDRLHDVGLARAGRARGINIAAGATGIIVVADRGPQALADAGVTTLLLASRLSIPAAPASLGDPASIDAAATRLGEAGATHLALSPCVIGPETDPAEFAALSAAMNAPSAPPLGAHPAIAQLVAVRYGEALNIIAVASH